MAGSPSANRSASRSIAPTRILRRGSTASRNGRRRRRETQLSSWPGLSRPSTSFFNVATKTWMPGSSPGMTKEGSALLPLRKLLRQKLRQHLDAGGPRAAGRRHQMHRAFRLLPAFQDHLDLARTDRIADDELRKVGDAEASEQRGHDGLAVVDAQLSDRTHAGLLARRIGV